MAPLPKQDDSDIPVVVGRRSARLSMIVPITIRGTDSTGQAFKENTWTIGVNKQGAKLATFHQLALGDQILIENPVLGRTAKARVMRVGEKRFTEDPYEIGIELLEAQNVWGVKFPPEDWQKSGPPATVVRLPEKTGAAVLAQQPATPAPQPEAKAAEVPGPAVEPAVPPAEPTEHPEKFNQFNLAVKALSRFAEEAGKTAQAPEKPAQPSRQFDLPPPAGLLEVVRRLEEKLSRISTLEQQVDTLVNRLEASRAELDRLLSKVQEVQHDWRSEVERAPHNIEEAGWRALQPALEELEGKLRKELDSASSRIVDQARQRVQVEASAAAETLGKEAGARLASLTHEYISKSAPELQARETEATEQAREQINRVIQKAAADFSEKLEKLSAEMSPALRREMEKSLEKSAEGLMGRLIESFQKMAQTAARNEESSFQEALGKIRQQIQGEVADAPVKVRQLIEQEADGAGQAIAKRLDTALSSLNQAGQEATTQLQATIRKVEVDSEGVAEGLRKRMAELSTMALQGFQNYTDTQLNGFKNELQETLGQFQEKSAKETSERLQKIAEEHLESSAKELQKQTADALDMSREELESTGKAFAEAARLQLEGLARSTLTSIDREAKASDEKFRGQLQKTLEENEERGARDLEAHLLRTAEKQRESIVRGIEEEAGAATERAVARLKSQSDRVTSESSDLMYKQVGVAEVVMKDWADQAKARLDSYFQKSMEVFRKQIGDLSMAALEGHLRKSEILVEGLHERLQQAALLFRGMGAEADVPKHLKIEPSAVQGRKQAVESLEPDVERSNDKEDRTVNDATEAFRSKLAEILEGYQTRAKETPDRKP